MTGPTIYLDTRAARVVRVIGHRIGPSQRVRVVLQDAAGTYELSIAEFLNGSRLQEVTHV